MSTPPVEPPVTGLPDLASVSPIEPSGEVDARVLRAAHAELRAAVGPRWQLFASRAWTRVALPAAITVTVVGYLHWAFVAASALHQ